MDVFVLYFVGPDAAGHWFGKFIGVYSSQARAARAVERLQRQPSYSHYPRGFQVEWMQIDADQEAPDVPPPNPPLPPG